MSLVNACMERVRLDMKFYCLISDYSTLKQITINQYEQQFCCRKVNSKISWKVPLQIVDGDKDRSDII